MHAKKPEEGDPETTTESSQGGQLAAFKHRKLEY
jgi:hypothetical protein